MSIIIPAHLLAKIHAHGERAFPDEGAGFLFGTDKQQRIVVAIYELPNAREDAARHNRYLITPQDYLKGELEAERQGLDLIGVFHSHPDSPNLASEYDRDWAQPYFSYIITSVYAAKAIESRSWRLSEDRSEFIEENII
ncbi:MAG: M67 family metallopeptidase [Chloroflexota bacterium]